MNNDKIIITPTVDPASIENVTLDITVKNVFDLHHVKCQGPIFLKKHYNDAKKDFLWCT